MRTVNQIANYCTLDGRSIYLATEALNTWSNVICVVGWFTFLLDHTRRTDIQTYILTKCPITTGGMRRLNENNRTKQFKHLLSKANTILYTIDWILWNWFNFPSNQSHWSMTREQALLQPRPTRWNNYIDWTEIPQLYHTQHTADATDGGAVRSHGIM